MVDALKAGNVDAAKEAFSALQQDVTDIQKKAGDAGVPPHFGTRPAEDVQALKSALESGDVSEAKKAFRTLMQDVRQVRRHVAVAVHHYRSKEESGGETTAPPIEAAPPEVEQQGGTINITA